MKVLILKNYKDVALKRRVLKDEEIIVTEERAKELVEGRVAKIIEKVSDDKLETATIEIPKEKKETAIKKNGRKKIEKSK